jgi:hypothetical protein
MLSVFTTHGDLVGIVEYNEAVPALHVLSLQESFLPCGSVVGKIGYWPV